MDLNGHRPFYLFMHIHKTAGTTLRYIIDQQLGPKNVLTYYNQPSTQLLDNLEAYLIVKPNYQAIIGHFGFGLHKKIGFPSVYITFLRHPVARTVSHYKESLVNHPERLRKKNGSIRTLTESVSANPEEYQDYQANFLVSRNLPHKTGASLSELALENLDTHFQGIGLVEYFDESIALMSTTFGWTPHEYQKLNVKDIKVEITPELIEQILSINKHDLIIYESIKHKLLVKFSNLK